MKTKFLILSIILLVFTACSSGYKMSREVRDAPYIYVDFEKFKEGRVCSDVRFECLPESQDKAWQDEPLEDGLDVFELNNKVMVRYNASVKKMWEDYEIYHSQPHPKGEKEPMFTTDLDRDFFDRVEAKQFLVEMEESLEKEFPGFWRNSSKKVRYRWLRRAMSKAKMFGYDPKLNQPMIELCARIGLDFDLNPKWHYITKFIVKKELHIPIACDYIDFTIFEKDRGYSGVRLTDWAMRRAIGVLPDPKIPYPKLNN